MATFLQTLKMLLLRYHWFIQLTQATSISINFGIFSLPTLQGWCTLTWLSTEYHQQCLSVLSALEDSWGRITSTQTTLV